MLIKCLFTDTHTMVRVRKIALMGFPAVGKSSLMYRFVEGRFDETYTTTIETRLETDITVGTKDFKLVIYDTMGVVCPTITYGPLKCFMKENVPFRSLF
eukprot:m.10375 g.10375  ORF g.10375 m.10375 type:complete len:99 (-) comp5556_c0_seq1:1011-1307(-)